MQGRSILFLFLGLFAAAALVLGGLGLSQANQATVTFPQLTPEQFHQVQADLRNEQATPPVPVILEQPHEAIMQTVARPAPCPCAGGVCPWVAPPVPPPACTAVAPPPTSACEPAACAAVGEPRARRLGNAWSRWREARLSRRAARRGDSP